MEGVARKLRLGVLGCLVVLTGFLVGCGSDDDDALNPPANHAPRIASASAVPAAIGVNSVTLLHCTASDEDAADSLVYHWSCDYGLFTDGNSGHTVTWRAPGDTLGEIDITVQVWDGELSADTVVTVMIINQLPATPSNPSPVNDAVNVPIQPSLYWSGADPDGDTLSYALYLGLTLLPTLVDSNLDESYYEFTDDSLEYETEYFWKVVARDPAGRTAESELWSFTTAEEGAIPPNSPSQPNPSDGTTNASVRPTLTWQASDPQNQTLLYDVYLGDAWPPSLVATNLVDRSYRPDSLAYTTTHYWKVVVRNEDNETAEGPVWTFKTGALPNNPPNEPSNPSPEQYAYAVNEYTALSWTCNDPDGDLLYYDVFFGDESPPSQVAANLTVETWQPPERLESDEVTYYWRILAKDAPSGGLQTFSPIWRFVTRWNRAPDLPSEPFPVNNATNVDLDVTLYWVCSDPDQDEVRYSVYLGMTNPPTTLMDSTLGANYYQPQNLTYDQDYFWRVDARDGYGNSRQGTVWAFHTMLEAPETPVLEAPLNDTTVARPVTFVWHSAERALQYQFQISGVNDAGFNNPLHDLEVADTTVVDLIANLTGNYEYHWRVRGAAEEQYSSWSTRGVFRTQVGAPALSQPLDNAVNVPVAPNTYFEWSEPAGSAARYWIEISTDEQFTNVVVENNTVMQVFYMATGLQNNTEYFWRVTGIDSNDVVGEPSEIRSFTTQP